MLQERIRKLAAQLDELDIELSRLAGDADDKGWALVSEALSEVQERIQDEPSKLRNIAKSIEG